MKHKHQDKQRVENTEQRMEAPESPETAEALAAATAKTQELQQQLDDSRNQYLYLLSDFENYKRNVAKERLELQQTAGRDILAALLPVLDDFDRAAKQNALNEGTALIHQKIQNILLAKGLRKLDVQAGEDFNADTQEAVAEIPAASDELKGKIVDIVEQGYQLGERIIRFAKVVVGR